MKKIGLFLLSSGLFVASGFTHAQAETVACTVIDSLPYTISTQGVYCLTGHLNTGITSGAAITIATNNVVLDLNGFKIGGLSAGLGTQAYGIYANQRQNITLKNGTVRGFQIGIYLNDSSPYITSQGHLIEDIRVDQNTWYGINILGKGNTIRNNLVVATGGTTSNPNAYFGISIYGAGAQVLNNTVTDVTAKGTGYGIGIDLVASSNSVVMSNRISTVTSPGGGTMGIHLNSGIDILVSDNRISGTQYGIFYSTAAGATGSYMNNLVRSSGTQYIGGTDAPGTNF